MAKKRCKSVSKVRRYFGRPAACQNEPGKSSCITTLNNGRGQCIMCKVPEMQNMIISARQKEVAYG